MMISYKGVYKGNNPAYIFLSLYVVCGEGGAIKHVATHPTEAYAPTPPARLKKKGTIFVFYHVGV
jgi:hypothetical protein